ncbi:MAG: pantoate--beta-alanine ligase [Acidimicrobiia bacterium]|nr:pantoate--beta-alanine ligase [Acidimicrobiia bacterium]
MEREGGPTVQVIERVAELAGALDAERAAGHGVGLVPTMGALHAGHASLIERAARECDVVCATVFVNPLQFGPGEDYDAYPRHLDADVAAAEKAGATLVFAPGPADMFPAERRTWVHVGGLGDVLEGASRPGHLDGVATVVAKLFALAGRCRAYFGDKDYQQLVVVRRLVADLSFPVDVVACPTVRDVDGVALSSRNRFLGADERAAAPVLFRALRAGAASVLAGELDPAEVASLVVAIVEAEPLVTLDYAEVVDAATLEVPEKLDGELRLLVAVRLGQTRLIDSVGVVVPG